MGKWQKVIIIAVVLIISAIVINLFGSFRKKTDQAPSKPQPRQLQPIKVADWKTYQNKDFSFTHPADWKIATQEAKILGGIIKSEIISNIVLPIIPTNASNSAQAITPPEGGSITIQTTGTASQSAQQFSSPIFTPATKLKLGKTDIQTYTLKQHGALINYLIIPYKAGTVSYILSFDYYNYQHPDRDYLALFDEIINSFKFTLEK